MRRTRLLGECFIIGSRHSRVLMSQTASRIQISLGWTRSLTERKFYLLFLSLLAVLVLYPYIQHTGFGYLGFHIFGSAVILLSVYAVSFRRGFGLLALALAVPTLVQRIMLPELGTGALSLVTASFSFAFDLVIIVIIFRRVFAADEPNSETIFGALCIYLLVGFSFSSGYLMLIRLQPHAFHFDPAYNLHNVTSRFDFIYYSFGTLTSLGAPGITPAADEARSLSVIEAILGVLYLAVLISRLINMYKRLRS
jgi:hypothetical protein